MTETRFPSSGLSAEYGDIVISDVMSDAAVSIIYAGNTILSEIYTPDNDDKVTIKGIGDLAMIYFTPGDLLPSAGEDGSPVLFYISISSSGTTISKQVFIYPSLVDFNGSLDVTLLKKIPLSRTNKKNTAPGRKEFVSFYGGVVVMIYAVYKGLTKDIGVSSNFIELPSVDKIYAVDVSPDVVAAFLGQSPQSLVYYSIYADENYIIKYNVSSRYFQFEKTFVFRNCFGAQESFTCTGDEISGRKWTREFGNFNNKKIDFSRSLENSIKINTGFLTKDSVQVVEDMLNSDDISIVDGNNFLQVTILEEDFSDTSRKDELNSVTFNYRLATNKISAKYKALKRAKIFSSDFDNSFE